jgi:hypothetical protein
MLQIEKSLKNWKTKKIRFRRIDSWTISLKKLVNQFKMFIEIFVRHDQNINRNIRFRARHFELMALAAFLKALALVWCMVCRTFSVQEQKNVELLYVKYNVY